MIFTVGFVASLARRADIHTDALLPGSGLARDANK
jgi:hypothetical protein